MFNLWSKIKVHTQRSPVLIIVLPALIELVLSQLFGMVDTIMLGHTEMSAAAIAAVGLTINPTNLVLGVLSAFNIGVTAAVAWSVGAQDDARARSVARHAMLLNALLGVVFSAGLFFGAPHIVRTMGADETTFIYSKQYLQIIAVGLMAQAMTLGCTASLRGVGQTRYPMAYNLFSNLLNVFGNYILIYGKLGLPEMGVAGAALSTTISRFIACGMAFYMMLARDTQVRIRLRERFRLRLDILRSVLNVGSTAALEQLIMQIGFIFFARTVSSLGTDIFAAHQIGLSVNGLSWVPSQAFGVAATTLVGQALGAGEKDSARKYATHIHRLSLYTAGGIALLFVLFSHAIAGLYTNDSHVTGLAGNVLKLIALGLPGIATQIPIAAALRGAGDTRFPLMASAIGIWVFRVAVAPLLTHTLGLGLNGAWLSIVLDQWTRAAVVYTRFRSNKWMNKHVIPIKGRLHGEADAY